MQDGASRIPDCGSRGIPEDGVSRIAEGGASGSPTGLVNWLSHRRDLLSSGKMVAVVPRYVPPLGTQQLFPHVSPQTSYSRLSSGDSSL